MVINKNYLQYDAQIDFCKLFDYAIVQETPKKTNDQKLGLRSLIGDGYSPLSFNISQRNLVPIFLNRRVFIYYLLLFFIIKLL